MPPILPGKSRAKPRPRGGEEVKVAAAQIAPVWLDRAATLRKVAARVEEAADAGCALVAFGECLVPGYPFWIEHTDGARFNSAFQKELHAHYLDQAVQIEAGHLDAVRRLAKKRRIAVVLGCLERPRDRGGHSVYAAQVYVRDDGEIDGVHRKLMPTHEERLTWAPGDGHGLRVRPLGPFTVGGLNCWENWMPLARAALYGLGEDLHVASWPGSARNTRDLTRFLAEEARSYVLSASGLMRRTDIPPGIPHADEIRRAVPEVMADGGSCIAGPDGRWVEEPLVGREGLLVATLDHSRVRQERQNFDPAGHYGRPDVLQLAVDRRRQSTILIRE